MFWRFGGYANISTIDSVLDKPDVTLEEVLDESDLLQELKQHNTKLIEFLRDDAVFHKLLDYVISTPLTRPEDDLAEEEEEEEEEKQAKKETKSAFSPVRSLSLGRSRIEKSKKQEEREERQQQEKARQKHAFVASEILSSEVWSIIETLMESRDDLTRLWDFLRRSPTLDPVTAGYFTKINEALLDKKTEEMLEFFKSQDDIVQAMLQHVDCPMIMDLLLKIISMEKTEGGQGIVDWLQSQSLIPLLLDFLGQEHPTFTQTSAGDFIKAIITISANASQNEQSCIGPNSLTRQLVSETCIKSMIANMLKGGNSLTVGVGIIIEVIRKNNSDYDPELANGPELPPSSGDPIYLGALLRQFAIHVPQFMALILSSSHTVSDGEATVSIIRRELPVAFGKLIEPLGFDRFKTCELMAELLHCSNMGLLNERGSEAYVRQRDAERERLRLEGRFSKIPEPASVTTEFSEESIDHPSESPELIFRPSDPRRHEVTSNVDDDGFEDVGSSRDLADTMRDDLEPFPDTEATASPLRPSKSRLSLDDEFFDEPLHSPLHTNDSDTTKPPASKVNQGIPSPSAHLASGVRNLEIEGRDDSIVESAKSPIISTTDDLVAEIDAHLLPENEKQEDHPVINGEHNLGVSNESLQSHSPGNMSPHSEDTPAPLFSPQNDQFKESQELSDGQKTPTQDQDTVDEQWSTQATDEWTPHIETDIDGHPIVGDFLKMQFVEHKVVPTILDFFFRFPWNNFLHNVVYDVVQQVFNGTMERGYNRTLAIDLFINGLITERVIEGQLRSDEVQAHNNLRLGYMGHLTLIAEEVVKFSERHPAEVLSEPVLNCVTERLWTDYVENTLSETRERDNAILGGVRPDAAGGARQAVLESVGNNATFSNTGSSALANAGLNGGTIGLDSMDLTVQTGGNFLSGGSLLSGFGSSSDEEDEDMEEIIEAEDGGSDQQSKYAPTGFKTLSLPKGEPKSSHDNESSSDDQGNSIMTPSSSSTSDSENNTGSQETSESGPFLPPPLKIPPSRARKQLAVRLALKEKERQEEKEKARASNSKNESVEVAVGSIFSPTEGRTSTPDTPAFTTGSKIHERGLHAQRQLNEPDRITATEAKDTKNPTRSDNELSDEEDIGDDPWASLDAAAEAVATTSSITENESGSKPKNERSWFGSSFASPKQATTTVSSSPTTTVVTNTDTASSSSSSNQGSMWGRITGESTRTDDSTNAGDRSTVVDESETLSHGQEGSHDDDGDGEEVVIGFAGSAVQQAPSSHSQNHHFTGTAHPEMHDSTEKNDALSTAATARPRSRGDSSNRSAMSRLFQSWQGDTSTSNNNNHNTGDVDQVEESEA